MMKLEKVEINFVCEKPINCGVAALRGFFGNLYKNRPEFHGHVGRKLIYKHPLIQYKIFGGSAFLIGLKEGAYLLKAVPNIEYIELYNQKYSVVKQSTIDSIVEFGLTNNMISYSFLTPWVGLNKENYHHYLQLKRRDSDIHSFLNKILIGNIISMSKSLRYTVDKKILIRSCFKEYKPINIKQNVALITFEGEFETNFLIPDFWGIGGKVSFGYGTVKRKNGGETKWRE